MRAAVLTVTLAFAFAGMALPGHAQTRPKASTATIEDKAVAAMARQDEMDARLLARARRANDLMCTGCLAPEASQTGTVRRR